MRSRDCRVQPQCCRVPVTRVGAPEFLSARASAASDDRTLILLHAKRGQRAAVLDERTLSVRAYAVLHFYALKLYVLLRRKPERLSVGVVSRRARLLRRFSLVLSKLDLLFRLHPLLLSRRLDALVLDRVGRV